MSNLPRRIFIQVPFDKEKRDKLKRYGARFDWDNKEWYYEDPGASNPQKLQKHVLERFDLDVPRREKDDAKALGAKWDGETWYAPTRKIALKCQEWMYSSDVQELEQKQKAIEENNEHKKLIAAKRKELYNSGIQTAPQLSEEQVERYHAALEEQRLATRRRNEREAICQMCNKTRKFGSEVNFLLKNKTTSREKTEKRLLEVFDHEVPRNYYVCVSCCEK